MNSTYNRQEVQECLIVNMAQVLSREEYAKFKLEQTASIGRILFPSEKNSSSETAVKVFAESIREFLAKKNPTIMWDYFLFYIISMMD